jgi:hypothetical protein
MSLDSTLNNRDPAYIRMFSLQQTSPPPWSKPAHYSHLSPPKPGYWKPYSPQKCPGESRTPGRKLGTNLARDTILSRANPMVFLKPAHLPVTRGWVYLGYIVYLRFTILACWGCLIKPLSILFTRHNGKRLGNGLLICAS